MIIWSTKFLAIYKSAKHILETTLWTLPELNKKICFRGIRKTIEKHCLSHHANLVFREKTKNVFVTQNSQL